MPVDKGLVEQTHLMVRLGVGELPQRLFRRDALRDEILDRVDDLVICHPAFYPVEPQPRPFPAPACHDKLQPIKVVTLEAQRPEAVRDRRVIVEFIEADKRRVRRVEQPHSCRPLLCLPAQTGYIEAFPEIEVVPSDFGQRIFDRLGRAVVERPHKAVPPSPFCLCTSPVRASQFRNASARSSPTCCRLSVCSVS